MHTWLYQQCKTRNDFCNKPALMILHVKMLPITTCWPYHHMSLCWLLQDLITTSLVAVDADGLIAPSDVQSALLDTTCLVSIMHSNNEVGCVQPIADIVQLARQQNVLVHSDAAQSIGKVCSLVAMS